MRKRKKKGFLLLILLIIAVGIGGIGYYIYFRDFDNARIYYKDFGIYLPSEYNIHGIDVSHHQRRINWKLVEAMKKKNVSIKFAFIKATESDEMVDAYFSRNWEGCKENGIIRGAYHYFNPGENAANQATLFTEIVKLSPGDLPPVLDIEKTNEISDLELRKKITIWLKIIERHYHVKPIIYTYADFYEDHLAGSFDDYPLWIAHYTGNKNPRVRRKWHFWQHHETGRVNGIRGKVDFNVFNGDSASFKNLLTD